MIILDVGHGTTPMMVLILVEKDFISLENCWAWDNGRYDGDGNGIKCIQRGNLYFIGLRVVSK